jgi:anaerobic selenocysteine-containing dehydrogenase
VSESDARRLGLAHGVEATVTGPGGSVRLPVAVDRRVAAGTAVLPRNPHGLDTAHLVGPADPETGAVPPLRVTLEPAEAAAAAKGA